MGVRLGVSLGIGAVAFFVSALILITLQEAIKNPLIAVAAGMMGLAAFAAAYLLDMLTTPRE